MASEKAVQAARAAVHRDALIHPEAISAMLDAAFPVMLRERVEAMAPWDLGDAFNSVELGPADAKAAVLRVLGVGPT